jgi:myo-inositol-1(or 4)-monophosphatase
MVRDRGGQAMAEPHRGVPDPQQLLEIARSVVRPAAELAVAMRDAGVGEVSTKTTDTDVVTAADRAVERQAVAALRRARPGDAVLGEEGSTVAATGGRVRWILDPIDGTVNYLYGLPLYAVSLAAEVDGVVVAGVVRNATSGAEWTAIRGRGAYRDGRRLTGSRVTDFGHALLGTGFAYDPARRAHQAAVLAALLPHVRDVRRMGAAALDLCLTAEGALDVYYEKGLHLWDHAAGGLVAAEAGLRVTGLAGAPPGPDLVIAAPPALYDELHERLVALDAAGGP